MNRAERHELARLIDRNEVRVARARIAGDSDPVPPNPNGCRTISKGRRRRRLIRIGLNTASLTCLLHRVWGIRPPKVVVAKIDHRKHAVVKRGHLSGRLDGLPESMLWNYRDEVIKRWKDGIARAHPDRGGRHRDAAFLNSAKDRTLELFARRGIA